MNLPNANSLIYLTPTWQTVYSAWAEHLPAAFWLIEQLRPRLFVELGSHAGDSYCAFVQAMQALGLDAEGARAMAVDSWQGDEHSHAYGSHIYDALAAHHTPLYEHFSRLNKCFFDDALKDVEDGSVDLLHIDGLHTYEAVRHDFETWRSKLSSRGVVLFHDVSERQEGFGVWKLWDELKLQFSHLLLPHGHGLGILAVGSDISKEFLAFLSSPSEAKLSESQQSLIAFLRGIGGACEERRLGLVAKADGLRIQQFHDTLAEKYNHLSSEYSALEKALENAREQHRLTEAHLSAIEASTSWKLTAPLRRKGPKPS